MYRQWKPTVQHNVLYYHFICINFTYLLFLNFHRIYSVLERRHRNVQWKDPNPAILPCNEFAFPLPIHEGTKLLNEVVKTLGALVEELVDQLARLAKVRQLVEVAVVLGVWGGDHLSRRVEYLIAFWKLCIYFTPSKTAPGSNCIFFPMIVLYVTGCLVEPTHKTRSFRVSFLWQAKHWCADFFHGGFNKH